MLNEPLRSRQRGNEVPATGIRHAVMSALETIFNFLALNLAFLLTSVVVVTLPLTISAIFRAFERKRQRREDRLVREYVIALRSATVRRTLVVNGVPLALIALGAEEVHYFAVGGGIVGRFCFGLGISALLVTATALGYVFLLEKREPALDALNIWSAAAQIAVRNVLRTGPIFVAEIILAVWLGFTDPALCLLGLPTLLLYAMYRTAAFGLGKVT
jgi:hypothetical protein